MGTPTPAEAQMARAPATPGSSPRRGGSPEGPSAGAGGHTGVEAPGAAGGRRPSARVEGDAAPSQLLLPRRRSC
eukprot:15452181-Alexandrium_andersonii.AAC.1